MGAGSTLGDDQQLRRGATRSRRAGPDREDDLATTATSATASTRAATVPASSTSAPTSTATSAAAPGRSHGDALGSRSVALDGLRTLAIVLVILYHLHVPQF